MLGHVYGSDLAPHGERKFRKSTMPCADFKDPQGQTLIREPLNHHPQDCRQPIVQSRMRQMRAPYPIINVRKIILFLDIHHRRCSCPRVRHIRSSRKPLLATSHDGVDLYVRMNHGNGVLLANGARARTTGEPLH